MAAPAKHSKITIREVCVHFAAKENVEEGMILINNPNAQKILSLWSRCVPCPDPIEAPDPNISESELWDWMWEAAPPGTDTVRSATGLPEMDFEIAYRQMRDARLIYPDGTSHEEAVRLLRGIIAAALPAQFRKKRKA